MVLYRFLLDVIFGPRAKRAKRLIAVRLRLEWATWTIESELDRLWRIK